MERGLRKGYSLPMPIAEVHVTSCAQNQGEPPLRGRGHCGSMREWRFGENLPIPRGSAEAIRPSRPLLLQQPKASSEKRQGEELSWRKNRQGDMSKAKLWKELKFMSSQRPRALGE